MTYKPHVHCTYSGMLPCASRCMTVTLKKSGSSYHLRSLPCQFHGRNLVSERHASGQALSRGMAPPSIRNAKRSVDDPILQRAKYLCNAAKAYEISSPVFAAHLGRQALKVLQISCRPGKPCLQVLEHFKASDARPLLQIVSDASKGLSRELLQSLCAKCGYPWAASDKKRQELTCCICF